MTLVSLKKTELGWSRQDDMAAAGHNLTLFSYSPQGEQHQITVYLSVVTIHSDETELQFKGTVHRKIQSTYVSSYLWR